jgi:peptide/nickel transport system substrate-binding protein
LADRPVGTGPYRFVAKDKEQIRLAWNQEYWDQGPGFKADELIINHSADEDQRRRWLLDGRTQLIINLNPHLKVSLLRAGAQVRIFSQASARQYFVVINPRARRPANQLALGDPEFRRALNQAVDVERIINLVLLGNGIPLSSPLNDQILGYSPAKPYAYAPKLAQKTVRRLAPQGLSLTLAAPRGRYVGAVSVARAVGRYLEQTGLKVKVECLDWPRFLPHILDQRTADWDLYFLGWGNPLLDAGYTLSPGFCQSPLTRVCPPDLPEVLARASHLSGPPRDQLFGRLNRRLRTLAPWIFLYQGVDNYATARGLKLRTHPNQNLRVYYDLVRAGS